MGFLDKITANLKLTEIKKNSLQRALLVLLLEWKDLEEHLGCIQQPLEECLCELESREKHLVEVQQSVAKSSEELETCRQSIECKEKEFRKFREEQDSYFNLKEKQLFAIEKSVQESVKEIELREEKINALQKVVKGFFEKIELEQKQFEPVQESIRERLKEISLKEAYFESRLKEICSIQNWIERRAKELDTKEEALDLKEKHLDSIHKEIESEVKQLDCVPNSKDQQSEDFCSADTNKELIHDCFKEFQSKKKQFQLDQKLLEERSKELELRERQLEDRLRELAKQKKPTDIVPSHVEIEQVKDVPATNLIICPLADLEFNVTMDVRKLQFFLNEDHDSLSGEVVKVLQLSVDPAKLVLDAMEGFYPPNLKNSKFEFGGCVVQRSCILLLEQLIKISPQIRPHVKKQALVLAGMWRAKMGTGTENSLEMLCFLHFLAAFQLASVFDADELLKLLKLVAQYTQTLELCRLLNLADKVPDLVQYLINQKQPHVAVRFVCTFGLRDKFPPEILIRDCLRQSRKFTKGKGNKSSEVLNDAIHKRVAALRDIIICIVDYKIVSEYSPATIEKYIEELIMQMADNKCTASAPSCEGQKQQKNKEKRISAIAPTPTKALTSALVPPRRSKRISMQSRRCMSSNTVPISPKALATASIPPKAIGPIPGTATAMPAILAKMDGKNLLVFLNQHFEDLNLMHSDVYVALQMSPDPGNLVLNALQGFHFPHQKTGHEDFDASVIRSSCIMLLEQLMRISPDIDSRMKREALELALHWKEQMRIEADFLETLVFLQLVGTYRLVSSFEANELLNLFKNVTQHKCAPELYQVLGFSQRIPGGDMERHNLAASEFSTCICTASHPAKLVLDALRGCYNSNVEENKTFSWDVMKSFSNLLELLMRISPEINLHVTEEAMKFAVHWKAKWSPDQSSCLKEPEVLAFLQLLAAYKLAASVCADELLHLLDTVHHRKSATRLSRALGLAHKMTDFVQNLIQKEEWLQAVRYIYEFELADKFPPVPLLKSHLSGAKELAKKIREEGQNSQEAESRAAKKELASLRDVTKCIAVYGLELESSAENLRKRIEQLERQKHKRKRKLSMPIAQDKKKYHASVSILSPKFQSEEHQVEKHPQVALPEELSSAIPVNTKQSPPQLERAMFTEQVRPCFGAPNRQYTPAIRGAPYLARRHAADECPMPHLGWRYRPDVAASWGTESSGFSGNHFALYNAPPYLPYPWR